MKKEIYLLILGVAGLASLMYVTAKETEPKKPKYPENAMVIVPMYEDNEGRELYTVTYQDTTIEYMYAEEIGMSILRDSLVTDEMIHFCDHEVCKENQ